MVSLNEYSKSDFCTFLLIPLIFSCDPEPFPILEENGGNYILTTEDLLQNQDHLDKIDTFYNSGEQGFFDGRENIKIFYKIFLQSENELGAIVISSGRTEAAIKYKELIFDLFNNGYSVYIHDHRGQGFSGRMLPDPDMGYVDEFQYYVDDMKYFYDHYVSANNHQDVFLLAHSMGGAIGVTYIEQYPNDFLSASFSSPMLGLPFPTCLAVSILSGDDPEYAIGNDSYQNSIVSFQENELTHSKVRYKIMLDVFDNNPKARLGGATYQWVNKSCDQFQKIFADISKIKIPVLLFSGTNDSIVELSSHNDFIYSLNHSMGNAMGFQAAGANHELLIERDEIRTAVVSNVLGFFAKTKNNL